MVDNINAGAPRVAPSKNSMAARRSKLTDARRTISEFTDYRSFKPFREIADGNPEDRCSALLSEATCLLSMLAAAFEDSGDLISQGRDSTVRSRSSVCMAGALEGIERIVALAGFALAENALAEEE